MKKVISLLTITVRSSIYKIILILISMSAAQLGIFYHTYLKYDYSENYLNEHGGERLGRALGVSWTLEGLVEKSRIYIVFLAAFALICVVLLWAESERKGTNTFYFYERLAVSRKQRSAGLTIYNMICMLFLIFAEVLTVLGLGMIFEYLVPAEYESVQMYFMAFYKSEFLHCLLPMADIYKWIRNLMVFTACAVEISASACRKKKSFSVVLLIMLVVLGFVQEIGSFGAMDIIMILTAGICLAINIYVLWLGGAEDDI